MLRIAGFDPAEAREERSLTSYRSIQSNVEILDFTRYVYDKEAVQLQPPRAVFLTTLITKAKTEKRRPMARSRTQPRHLIPGQCDDRNGAKDDAASKTLHYRRNLVELAHQDFLTGKDCAWPRMIRFDSESRHDADTPIRFDSIPRHGCRDSVRVAAQS